MSFFFVRNCILTLWLRQNVFELSFIDRQVEFSLFVLQILLLWVALKIWHFIHVWMSARKISWREIAESKGKLMPLWFWDTAKLLSKELVPIYILTTKAWDCASHNFKTKSIFHWISKICSLIKLTVATLNFRAWTLTDLGKETLRPGLQFQPGQIASRSQLSFPDLFSLDFYSDSGYFFGFYSCSFFLEMPSLLPCGDSFGASVHHSSKYAAIAVDSVPG